MCRELMCCVCLTLTTINMAQAGVGGKLLQEVIEYSGRKLGKEVAEEGAERLGRRMVGTAAKEGAEFLTRPSAMKIVSRYGDDGARALLRHGKVGEEVVEAFGETGAKALTHVSEQNGRRLAMMAKDGTLKPAMLDVVRQHGDAACDFIWKNKGALAVGATLTTFVTSPKEFLDGSSKLVGVVAENAVRPVAEIPAVLLGQTLGTITGLCGLIFLAFAVLAYWMLSNPKRRFVFLRLVRGGWGILRTQA